MLDRKTYEKYHSRRSLQKRVISDNDFTYKNVLILLKKYGVKRKEILDVGCGVGTVDFYMAKNGANVLGLDISHRGVQIARRNAKSLGVSGRVKFKVMNFPYKVPVGAYDMVVCTEVLEHLPEDSLAVRKMQKLLKPKGLIIASSPSTNSLLYRLGMLKGFDSEVGHLRRYTQQSYAKIFEKERLTILYSKRTQGVMRDLLFTSKLGGHLLRIINKWPFSVIFTFFDDLLVPILGESDIVLVAQKK